MVKSFKKPVICIPESIQCICEKPRLGWVEPSHLQTELTTHRTMLKEISVQSGLTSIF